ncbi:MAG TPA: hypothetical protein VKV39_14195 [Candidatus Sulfotelmatobacter sp.]|nr:hypothetical protein [Candidatus Sulfotelmatobacter sp.]
MRWLQFMALSSLLAIGLCLSAAAKDNHSDSGKFDLAQAAHVGSTTLQPGQYKVEWVGPNGDVHVSILQHGKIVATTEGQVVQHDQAAPYNSVTVKPQSDNSDRLVEIDFGKRKDALVLSGM